MTNELTLIEQNLDAITPQLEEVLRGGMPVARLKRTVMVSMEKTPKLLQCTKQSILQSAMSAGVLGLEVDGVTGQAFLVPFGGKAQLIIGYKGYNTMAARSRYSISGDVVCENDAFRYRAGTEPSIDHMPAADNRGRVIGAWAVASHKDMPPVPSYLNLQELMAVKAKSPGAKKKDSPWNDPTVGFPAMCSKTAKRRLARSMPLNIYQWGAAMDEAFEERGLTGHVTADGPVIEQPPIAPASSEQPALTTESVEFVVDLADGTQRKFMQAQPWIAFMQLGFSKIDEVERLCAFWDRNMANWEEVAFVEPEAAKGAQAAFLERKEVLTTTDGEAYG